MTIEIRPSRRFDRALSRILLLVLLVGAGCGGDVPGAGTVSLPADVIKRTDDARKAAITKNKGARVATPRTPRR
jgi:hypothetical protein